MAICFSLRIKKIKATVLYLIMVFFLIQPMVDAQILKDTVSLKLIQQSIDDIYNLNFNEPSEIITKLNQKYQDHPVIFLLKGLITYWKDYPLLPSSPPYYSVENDLRKCIQLCEANDNPGNEAEHLLANLSARGMLLMVYSERDLTIDVIPLAASTYKYIRESFDYTSSYSDFLFFTGLYNYTRNAYPEAYPVYKPVALLFPKGDKQLGIKELQAASRESILYKAEALSTLSGIYLSFENNYMQAYTYSKTLHEAYPANIQYFALHIRNTLLLKRYDEAEKLLASSGANIKNSYFLAQQSIFNGILNEKKYHNDMLAEANYLKGVHDISLFGNYGNEYAAYGYFGLSRIKERSGENNYSKTYLKKANELADFKNVNFDH